MASPATKSEDLSKLGQAVVPLPRVAIRFCTKCKWNLRAAYYAQELLSTFATAIGEVSLIPASGGVFNITLLHRPKQEQRDESSRTTSAGPVEYTLWDYKQDNGFPETKELKNRVRNIIEPGRDLGHTDRRLKKDREMLEGSNGNGGGLVAQEVSRQSTSNSRHGHAEGDMCEDCQ